MTFGSVTPRRQPEHFHELRRLFAESLAEETRAHGRATRKPKP
jgi:hypothetical protein